MSQFDRGHNCLVHNPYIMVFFVALANATQDGGGFINGLCVNNDLEVRIGLK